MRSVRSCWAKALRRSNVVMLTGDNAFRVRVHIGACTLEF